MILYLLQSSIQALIDMGARILSKLGEKPPSSYGMIGEELLSEGIITKEDLYKFK